ncbi:hypothetical protein [Weissella viridescens]|uniref:hypothetical protein n=1 Tax=Weissella viridescens TaxID=1629 RepID=UPI003AF22485
MTKIVQVLDTDGNGAYALTHWQSIEGDLKEIIMTDENGDAHTLKMDSNNGLLVDDYVLFNPNDIYTKTDVDTLLTQLKSLNDSKFALKSNVYTKKEVDSRPILLAPDGSHFRLTVDNTGKLGTRKV